ncbi:Protein AATF [Caligus rogercresseyi]|uniref:Protein AATF n=1 Tax=Caligus rogercresseyi TaxID=217165 RepID=A0A7T8QUV7_CALRO|nr:Protein AATF [Caligus rogercresseyi]
MPRKPKTLSEKLLAALEGEKVQDLIEAGAEDELPQAKTAGDSDEGSDEEIDLPSYGGVSALRAANLPSLEEVDPRYAGKKVSRKDLDEMEHEKAELGHMFEAESDEDDNKMEEDDEMISDKDIEDEEGNDEFDDESVESEDDENVDSNESTSDFDIEEEDDHFAALEDMKDAEEGSTALFESSTDAEVTKGTHIRNQLLMYDKLLEMRIQLQKVISTSMRLPKAGDSWESLRLCDFLESSLKAKGDLIQNRAELCKKRKSEEGFGEQLSKSRKIEDYEGILSRSASGFGEWRDEVLELWNEKTRLMGGKGDPISPLLRFLHKDRLINRTRVRRVEYDILGETEDWEEKEDPEIFDDGDFYHQLLRELISAKTNNWLEVQKIRSKMKKKAGVDTKASKGRKIRYDIHAKLVNFMAPSYVETMADEAKNELYSSLFGQKPKGTPEP